MELNSLVAKNVRRIREEKKLTLGGAAELTGVSRSMLAQIEHGDVNPTISVLWKISNGFKVSFTALMEGGEEAVTVVSGNGIPPISEAGSGYFNYPAFLFDEKRMFESYRIVIAPGGGHEAEGHLAGTEEYITVFAGEVLVVVGAEHYTLHTGDSIRFTADGPHSYRNVGGTEVQLSMILHYGK